MMVRESGRTVRGYAVHHRLGPGRRTGRTRYSGSVEPFPYHGMVAYPGTPMHGDPDSAEHREYRRDYQARPVTGWPCRDALKPEASCPMVH